MIPLERVEDMYRGPVVARNTEAHGAGSAVLRKMRATAARVAEIAAVGYRLLVRLAGPASVRAAKSRIQVAQTSARSGQALTGIEVGTGHGRYSSIGR